MVPLTIHEEYAIISKSFNNVIHLGVYDYLLTGLTACDSWLVDNWLVVLNLVGTKYRPIISFRPITNKTITLTLHAKSIAGHFTKNKWESSETGTRTEAVSVYCRSNDDRTRIVFRSRRNISSDANRRSLQLHRRLSSGSLTLHEVRRKGVRSSWDFCQHHPRIRSRTSSVCDHGIWPASHSCRKWDLEVCWRYLSGHPSRKRKHA